MFQSFQRFCNFIIKNIVLSNESKKFNFVKNETFFKQNVRVKKVQICPYPTIGEKENLVTWHTT